MHHLKFEMEEQWNFLKNYSNKETDKAARDTLAITDQQMCGQTVSFKGVPGQKVRILMRSINAEQEMLEEQKTQEATDKSVKQVIFWIISHKAKKILSILSVKSLKNHENWQSCMFWIFFNFKKCFLKIIDSSQRKT